MASIKSGTTTGKRRVKFSFPATEAAEVCLAGDFNGWRPASHPLRRQADGSWSKTLVLQPDRYEYKFVVDGCWELDPSNPERCPNDQGSENNWVEVTAR